MESAASLPQEPLTRDPEEIPTSEVKLRQVVDMIPALVRFWSNLADSPNDFSNQGWRDYTGISSEEARGRGWQAAVHPDDLPKLLETWREMVAAGKGRVLSNAASPHDGGVRGFFCRGEPPRGQAGKGLLWCGTTTGNVVVKKNQEK